MATKKTVKLDEIKGKEIETFKPEDMPPYPKVYDPPEGWPRLRACDGDSWYERACIYEAQTGRRVLPDGYCYEEGTEEIIRVEDRVDKEEVKDGDK